MPQSSRAGDILADRYRLDDLLSESEDGRFWRAHDSVLKRDVALHVIRTDADRAPELLAAARSAAPILDRRLLRVLDAAEHNGVTYVVNEWGTGLSLDLILREQGPMAPRRAAWLVAEVAAVLTVAHEAGVAHGRLVPENVMIDQSGSVRVIGFAVDAALHRLPQGRIAVDVVDLAGLLYCALTGRWPGVSPSRIEPAPLEHGHPLRPRRVRAGIPRPLDALCDRVLNPHHGHHPDPDHDVTTARGIQEVLAEFVGDTSGFAEAEAATLRRLGRTHPMVNLDAMDDAGEQPGGVLPEETTAVLPAAAPDRTATVEPAVEPAVDDAAGEGPSGPTPVPELPTEAGLPIFHEDDAVSWLATEAHKAPPPPPFEDPPERPLFAPEPADGRPVRRPRPGQPTPSGEYWPWESGPNTGSGVHTGSGFIEPVDDEDEDDGEVPGRSALRVAAAIAACVVLVLAVLIAFNLGRGKTPLGGTPSSSGTTASSPTGSDSGSTAPAPVKGVVADDFDPQGSPPEENPDTVGNVVDGDPATTWQTMRYDQNLGPGGLKTGVGVLLDLGATTDVTQVDLTMVGSPTSVSIFVTDRVPAGVRALQPAATADVGQDASITLDRPTAGRYVVVWLTSLPAVDGGYRGEIAEASVLGTSR